MSTHTAGRLRNYFFAGVLTVIPIWITWVVFRFVVQQLSGFGQPWVGTVANVIRPYAPNASELLVAPVLENAAGLLLTLLALLVLGWAASRVIGRRVIGAFDGLVNRIPLVHKIYGSTKALLGALQQQPGDVRKVVLIEFPHHDMKTVGFVTRVLTDAFSGRRIAAVYVPTTPNPTSGYLELVPVERITSTDWTLDQAMTFVISGGTVTPDTVHYDRDAPGTNAESSDDTAPPAEARPSQPAASRQR